MLANVGVQLANGLLQINGSSSADFVSLTVVGGELQVKGSSGTTINGSTGAKKFPKFSVTSISATLGSGNDVISLDGVDQGLGGTLNTAGGNDIVNLSRSVLHGMLVQTGDGKDLVNVLSTTLQSVIVDTGAQDDLVTILDNTVFNFSSVVLGSGNDKFAAVKNTVFGFTSVDGGSGTDIAVGLWNSLPGGSFLTNVEYRYGI